MNAMPTLFLSHGSPMHALEPGAAGDFWRGLPERMPRPKAILMVSAHWETAAPALTGAEKPETIHDFYGFPRPLYAIRYPAPGAPGVALHIQDLLKKKKFNASVDPARGLDHGAWSPLLHAWPRADLPVLQLSVQTPLGPRHHLEMGRALAGLPAEGILVVGSGHMTHNLHEWSRGDPDAAPARYVLEFQEWARERIERHDLDALVEYRARSAGGARAHPTEEHFLPLFVALGAGGERAKPERLYNAVEGAVLAMDAYFFHPAA